MTKAKKTSIAPHVIYVSEVIDDVLHVEVIERTASGGRGPYLALFACKPGEFELAIEMLRGFSKKPRRRRCAPVHVAPVLQLVVAK